MAELSSDEIILRVKDRIRALRVLAGEARTAFLQLRARKNYLEYQLKQAEDQLEIIQQGQLSLEDDSNGHLNEEMARATSGLVSQ